MTTERKRGEKITMAKKENWAKNDEWKRAQIIETKCEKRKVIYPDVAF